jgi:hypothetical protein
MLREIGETHIRTTTGAAIRQAMRESFCPTVCAACEVAVFQECPELKHGNWEIFGQGVEPRVCVLPQFVKRHHAVIDRNGEPAAAARTAKEKTRG